MTIHFKYQVELTETSKPENAEPDVRLDSTVTDRGYILTLSIKVGGLWTTLPIFHIEEAEAVQRILTNYITEVRGINNGSLFD